MSNMVYISHQTSYLASLFVKEKTFNASI